MEVSFQVLNVLSAVENKGDDERIRYLSLFTFSYIMNKRNTLHILSTSPKKLNQEADQLFSTLRICNLFLVVACGFSLKPLKFV